MNSPAGAFTLLVMSVSYRHIYDRGRSSGLARRSGFPGVLVLSFIILFHCAISRVRAESPFDLFPGTNLLTIKITIPLDGMNLLRSYHWRQENPKSLNRPFALATVTAGNAVFTNVAVHLKGSFGSFRSVDRLPGLTLNFDKFAPGQALYGLHKLSLNNSVQDPTCLHEKLCRELFESAGVPVPRADHAVVFLNQRKLGLYVVTEGVTKHFLKRYFKKADGDLYDAGYLQDINHPKALRLDFGEDPEGDESLRNLFLATRELDSARRFKGIQEAVDLDRFLSMVALEVMLCHWDGYSMNRNNYRVYYDPESKKLVFMPHGMDQVLGIDRPNLDLPLVPRFSGIVSRALVSTRAGRQQYLARLDHLFTRLFDPDKLCRRVREMDAKIAPFLQPPQKRWRVRGHDSNAFVMSSGDHATDVDELCQRIHMRFDNLQRYLAGLSPEDVGTSTSH